MLHNEDRELQIKLAELQADIQIYLTLCFGFMALFAALMIGYLQIHFSLPPEHTFTRNIVFVSIVVCGIILLGFTNYFFNKARDTRKQMKELRKRYIW